MNEEKNIAKELLKKEVKKRFWAWAIPLLVGALPLFLGIFVVFVVCLAVLGMFDFDNNSGSISGSLYDFTGFNISNTLMSKDVFESKLNEATGKYPKLGIFAQNADNIYDIALSEGVNPELVVLRAISEGFSPGSGYNYWGIGCTNTGGGRDCEGYDSFNEGVKRFVEIVDRYSSLTELMSNYAYIGEYWYSPGSSSVGGCYYAEYIYDPIPSRVKNACANTCNTDGSGTCVKTTDEDQKAYANWQVSKMAKTREDIFDIKIDFSSTGDVVLSNDSVIMLSDAEAWNLLTGFPSRDQANLNVTQSKMDVRMVTIEVPIRVWSSADANDYSTKASTKKITVNRALANLYLNFFTDIYNEATDFVINPSEIYCYNFRKSTSGTRLSAHAYGVACDVNWSTGGNGYQDHVYTASEWNNLKKSKSKYQIVYKDSKVARIAHKYTLSWGGEWNSVTDAMHFSFIGDESRATLQNKY